MPGRYPGIDKWTIVLYTLTALMGVALAVGASYYMKPAADEADPGARPAAASVNPAANRQRPSGLPDFFITDFSHSVTHHRATAARAPGSIVIDGNLAEWPQSYPITHQADRRNPDRQAETRILYDERGLYFAIGWRDTTPMINFADPASQFIDELCWDGDCVQLRLMHDAERHVTLWYSHRIKQPGAHVIDGPARTQPGVPALARPIRVAFRKHADGKGYDQEALVPWSVATAAGKPLGPDQSMRLGLNLHWGKADELGTELMWQDLLAEGITPKDRYIFWTEPRHWGTLTFEP